MHDFRGDFEVHVTVVVSDKPELVRFQEWCRAQGCKCAWIVLSRGLLAQQPMATWRRRNTILARVVQEAEQCMADLSRAGLSVVRVKVEVSPDNEEVPLLDEDAAAHGAGSYFEHHVKLLRDKAARREGLVRACEQCGAHLSRNALRETGDGREERFVTLRSCGVGLASSERKFQRLLAALQELGEQIIDHESEYCVYDTNLGLDAGWLGQGA
jgi:hypothetical protein